MPSSGALFGNSATRSQNKNLVEFKAGKMTMKGKMVHPDKRKGLLYVYQSDDSLMHFCWKDRITGVVEDDLIVFPDDCEFKKVEQCTTGRVYVLKFKSSSRKFFFWIQEPRTDKDEENCKKLMDMLNNPPTAGSSRNGGHNPESDLQNLLGSMTQHQLMQLFGTFRTGAGGLSNLLSTMSRPPQDRNVGHANSTAANATGTTTTTTTTATTTSSDSAVRMLTTTSVATGSTSTSTSSRTNSGGSSTTQQIQLSDLQKYLSNLTQLPDAQVTPPPNVDLSDALNSESIASVLNDPSLIQELSPHLPNIGGSETTEQQLRSTITSPQFQQAVSLFSAALQSGHLGPVVQQFEVGENAINAAREGNMEEFVKALQNTSLNQDKNDEEPKQPEKKKKTDDNNKKEDKDDDEMAHG